MLKTFISKHKFVLESGKSFPEIQIAYHTYGKLNKEKDNVVWVTHALTANSDVFDWWKGLFGNNNLFNPEEHFIVCANVIGSHYGSTGPLSINPDTGNPYYHHFPEITIRDIVNAHILLRKHLGIEKIKFLIGGSLGGQQALEWAIAENDLIENLIVVATNPQHSPWGIAFNEAQRLAIKADRTWFNNSPDAGLKGLKAARAIALLSYRNAKTYNTTQKEESNNLPEIFKAVSYQDYQGEKLVKRFNAYSYWHLSKAMDTHNVGRNREGVVQALQKIRAKTLVIGISSDILFPTSEQKFLAENIPNANYAEIDSLYGHDGFLIETEKITNTILKHFSNKEINKINYELQN
jgi:homoserine O-acetyltransferase